MIIGIIDPTCRLAFTKPQVESGHIIGAATAVDIDVSSSLLL
jgi:hypothetical protein